MKGSYPVWVRRHKWLLLLIGIVCLLLISPISEVYARQDNVISPITGFVLISVTFGAAEKRSTAWWVAALALVWVVISIVTEGSGLFARESLLAPFLFMVLLLSIFILLAHWLIRVIHINAEVLCAAICGYLVIGLFWTGLYSFALVLDPVALISTSGVKVTLSDMFYFSYTTLTTTGFGDIIPRNPVIRMLAVMEAIVGTFYNTIVIARFVGLYGFKVERS